MIIKSMSRKSESFYQLYDYLTRDKSNFSFTRNTYSNSKNRKKLINEFMQNSKHLKDSRGKVYLYHELLSLRTNKLSKMRQKEILLDLANSYLEKRANNHISFGVIHEDKEHTHLHLMISSNEIEWDKRVRLSKKDFSQIQQKLENYKNQKYKELNQSSLYQDKKVLSRDKQKEQELKNRGVKSIREMLIDNLNDTFVKTTSHTYLENHLKSLGYEIYTRGKTQGIKFNWKNYRFKTLGLEVKYKQLLKRLEKIQQREVKWNKAKQVRSKNSRFGRER